MRLLLSTLFALIFCADLNAQYTDEQLNKIIQKGDRNELVVNSTDMIESGYFISAEKLVDKLLLIDPESANFNYRKGTILSEAYGNYAKAIPYLENAKTDIDKNYDVYSGSESSASVDVLYLLAKCQHRVGNLSDARTNYTAFLAASAKKSPLNSYAQLGLQQLEVAERLGQNPKRNVNIVNLGSVINTDMPEYSPVISFDGSALYYTSRRKWPEGQSESSVDPQYGLYPEDVYVSYKDFDESWTEPVRLDFCDADQNEASISVSMDERRIYVYQDIFGNGDIFYSDFSTNRFKDIKPYENKDVNSDYWDTHCNMTPDGRTMYFASERPGGFGGRDIYRVVKMPDGSWSKPFNLGPNINSEFDEDAPFMASDNKSLFFATNGNRSMGGFDILLTVINEDNQWSDPVNLGVPLNSTQDDVFYTETVDGRRGYITSMRNDTKGEKDIYEIQNDYMTISRGAVLKGKILVKEGKPLPEDLVISVTCFDCNPQFERTVYPRVRDGAFMMSLEPCHDYEIVFYHNDGKTEFYRERLSTDCKKEKEEIYREVLLDSDNWQILPPEEKIPVDTITVPVKIFGPIVLKHTFDYNKNLIDSREARLRSFLNAVEVQLNDGKEEVVISVYSSASFVPTRMFKDNQELSYTRARNIKEQLDTYFAASNWSDKVKVEIVSSVVSGPEYQQDPKNKSKYEPYQFIELRTR